MSTEFLNGLGSTDMSSFILVLEAYQKNAFREEIEDFGFNTNSGFVYIYLTNGVCIASAFAQDVTYISTDWDSGEEIFYNEYYNCLHNIKEDEENL